MKIKYLSVITSICLVLLSLLLLTSCKSDQKVPTLHSKLKVNTVKNIKESPPSSFFSVFTLPILIPKGELNSVIGWLSDLEIIYLTQSPEGSFVYRHHLGNGNSHLLFESNIPIVSGLISPDQKKILVHSSPSTYEGMLTIIDLEGQVLYSQTFPSVEMGFEWNHYNADQLLITTFKEDWSYTNFYLNIGSEKIITIDIRKPFAKWIGDKKVAFLDWNEDDISLISPLYQKEFNKEETLLEKNIFQFDTFSNRILTITVEAQTQQAKYSFFNNQMEELATYLVPVLSSYSGWIVPHYELTNDQEEFLTMLPFNSGEADLYKDGFEFVSYNLLSGKKEVILKKTDNIPFTCSPNKKLCLMGFQLEKVLNLQNKMIQNLF